MDTDAQLVAVSLAADTAAPAVARRVVGGLDLPETRREDAVLLTSEVVSNAVKHPGDHADGRVELRATRRGNAVRVEVANRREPSDAGDADRPGWDLRPVDTLPQSGWGLQLVDRLAARWGTVHEARRTVVWFEVNLDTDDRSAQDSLTSTV